jgi:hypothetical protein
VKTEDFQIERILCGSTRAKLAKLVAGGNAVVTETDLSVMCRTDYGNLIRSCRNRKRLGVLDEFVAWIHDSGEPKDLTFDGERHAYGSAD